MWYELITKPKVWRAVHIPAHTKGHNVVYSNLYYVCFQTHRNDLWIEEGEKKSTGFVSDNSCESNGNVNPLDISTSTSKYFIEGGYNSYTALTQACRQRRLFTVFDNVRNYFFYRVFVL